MSLLPQAMPPQSTPLGTVKGGVVTIERHWWLLLYNLVLNAFGSGMSAQDAFALDQVDVDVSAADTAALARRVANGALLEFDDAAPGTATALATRALLLAADELLPDSKGAAQPLASITVGASPFSYTAMKDGYALISGGTVSAVSLTRHGTAVSTPTTGFIPTARGDVISVTYSAAPTMTFVPS